MLKLYIIRYVTFAHIHVKYSIILLRFNVQSKTNYTGEAFNVRPAAGVLEKNVSNKIWLFRKDIHRGITSWK